MHYTYAEILESPKSKNITLGEPITLICIATGTEIEWETNPTISSIHMKKSTTVLNETNSLLNGTLELVGSAYTNNITVWCSTHGSSEPHRDKSDMAHVFVQGKPFLLINFVAIISIISLRVLRHAHTLFV